jgi:hypothetical protein
MIIPPFGCRLTEQRADPLLQIRRRRQMNGAHVLTKTAKYLMKPVAPAALLSAGLLLGAMAGTASASVPDAPEYGPIGGGEGQVLRVNVMAIDPELPVFVSVVFEDLFGRQVGPAAKLMVLRQGQADTLSLNFSSVGKGRTYVRPVVKYLEGSGKAMITTEMYDRLLGRTTAGNFVGNRFGLAGSVQFGPIGLAYGQLMRMWVSEAGDPNARCLVSIGFRTRDGAVVDPNVITGRVIDPNDITGGIIDPNFRVSLAPGQSAYVELNGSKLLRVGQHGTFLPFRWTPMRTAASPTCR